MVKYIIKRLLLSILILLGVSLIIYVLVRLMPADFLETKYTEQLKQHTMTQEQIDQMKKDAGVYMPDAYLTIVLGEGSEYSGVEFIKDAKSSEYNRVQSAKMPASDLYVGNYYTKDRDVRLEIKKTSENSSVGDVNVYSLNDVGVSIIRERGSFAVDDQNEWNDGKDYGMTIKLNGKDIDNDITYRKATGGEKAGAVFVYYFKWLGNMLRGDLGESFIHHKPVAQVIGEHMWVSFIISLIATVLQLVIAIPMGITSATHQYSVRDYTVTVITMMGISLPSFFFAALLIKIFSSGLGWFPSTGQVSGGSAAGGFMGFLDMVWHLVLPMTVLVVLSIGGLMRYTRTNMLEVLNSDYIRTARAKGLSESKVIYVHAFRNTMIPLMTLVAGILPSLFGGAMITEEVFSIDGIGRLAYKALSQGDLPFIMGYNMFLAVLTVIGTLLSDIMYAVVDPRVKLTK